MKTLINAWLIWRAAKQNSTGLVAAAITVNGGWRAALKANVIVWLVRVLVWIGSAAVLVAFSISHN